MRVALKCLVALTGLALAVSILLTSNHLAPNLQTPAIPRPLARPFAYPGPAAARMPRDPTPQTYPNVSFADASGNGYVAGYEYGTVQVTPGVVQPNSCPYCLGFVSKIDPTGQTILFSTNIEGFGVVGMAVDSQGDIFLAGQVPPVGLVL